MRWIWIGTLGLLLGCPGSDPGKGDSGNGTTATGTGSGSGTGGGTGAATGTGSGTGGGTGFPIEVGNGATSHSPAGAGAPVEMVHGPQQGWHIEVSGEVQGLGAVVGVVVEARRVDDGTLVASNENATFLQLADYDAASATGWFAGERALVGTDPDAICPLAGVELDLCARAEDLAAPGTFAEGCARVVAALDPIDVAPCANGTLGGTLGTGTGTGTGTGSP